MQPFLQSIPFQFVYSGTTADGAKDWISVKVDDIYCFLLLYQASHIKEKTQVFLAPFAFGKYQHVVSLFCSLYMWQWELGSFDP